MSKGFAEVVKPNPLRLSKAQTKCNPRVREMQDPRIKREPKHLLIDIVAIVILATLSGADNMVAVETYGKGKQEWLETFLELPHGIPSHDTFSRVLALIDPQEMARVLLELGQAFE